MILYPFQDKAIADLIGGKHICVMQVGSGKSAVMMKWIASKEPKKVLIITTASKSKSGDFIRDADTWNGVGWRDGLEAFEIISWHKVSEWVMTHIKDLSEWVYGIDELQRAKSGISSGMGKAFLKITSHTKNWAGFTATPGDSWLHFYPYFTACGFVKNKTSFLRTFAITQTFKGFPEIVGWTSEDVLKKWWGAISTTPDTSQMYRELPPEVHEVVEFKKPKGYDEVRKTRYFNGEFLDTCLPADTTVFTDDGYKELDKISVGDKVFSYNHATREIELKPVVKTYKFYNGDDVIKVSLSNGCDIISTKDHRHFVNGKYMRADEIKQGDMLYEPNKMLNVWETDKKTKHFSQQKMENKEDGRSILFKRMHIKKGGRQNKADRSYKKNSKVSKRDTMQLLQKTDGFGQYLSKPVEALQRPGDDILLQRAWQTSCDRTISRKSDKRKGKRIGEVLALYNLRKRNTGGQTHNAPTPFVQNRGKSVLLQKVLTKLYSKGGSREFSCTSSVVQRSKNIRQEMGERISCKDTSWDGQGISKCVQSGYRDARVEDSNRMRWTRPQAHLRKSEGHEKGEEIRGVRVESVEVLELRDIKRLGLYRDPDYVYCIDVEDNHNFFANGVLTHNCMGLCHALRSISFTKEKQQWLSDFIDGLGDGCVIFYNYIDEGNEIEQIIHKANKNAKVWRIDGSHHEIPTAETIGKYDVVLCQWQSGSEALNLQFLHYWVSVTPTYSYMTSVQARGRIRRLGQTHTQFYYYLKCDGIESDVYKALHQKKDFSEDVYVKNNMKGEN